MQTHGIFPDLEKQMSDYDYEVVLDGNMILEPCKVSSGNRDIIVVNRLFTTFHPILQQFIILQMIWLKTYIASGYALNEALILADSDAVRDIVAKYGNSFNPVISNGLLIIIYIGNIDPSFIEKRMTALNKLLNI